MNTIMIITISVILVAFFAWMILSKIRKKKSEVPASPPMTDAEKAEWERKRKELLAGMTEEQRKGLKKYF